MNHLIKDPHGELEGNRSIKRRINHQWYQSIDKLEGFVDTQNPIQIIGR